MLVIIVIADLWTTEGGDLDQCSTHAYMRKTKTAPYQTATREDRLDFLGGGIGRDVVVFGYFTQQQVTNTAPDNVGLEVLFLETPDNLGRMRTQLLNRNTMLFKRYNRVLSNIEFLKTLNNLAIQSIGWLNNMFRVVYHDQPVAITVKRSLRLAVRTRPSQG